MGGLYEWEIIPKGMKIEATVACRLCGGIGEIMAEKGNPDECPKCHGEGGEPITLILTKDVEYLGKRVN